MLSCERAGDLRSWATLSSGTLCQNGSKKIEGCFLCALEICLVLWKFARALEIMACSGNYVLLWKLVRALEIGSCSLSWFVLWKIALALENGSCSRKWLVLWKLTCALKIGLCSDAAAELRFSDIGAAPH